MPLLRRGRLHFFPTPATRCCDFDFITGSCVITPRVSPLQRCSLLLLKCYTWYACETERHIYYTLHNQLCRSCSRLEGLIASINVNCRVAQESRRTENDRFTGWIKTHRRGWWKSRLYKSTTILFHAWPRLVPKMGLYCLAATIEGTTPGQLVCTLTIAVCN